MGTRFIHFYFNKQEPDKIRAIVPSHIEYWNNHDLKGYLGGPFTDRSGGLITFEAENMDEATSIINNDPFVLEDLIENGWIKEWDVE